MSLVRYLCSGQNSDKRGALLQVNAVLLGLLLDVLLDFLFLGIALILVAGAQSSVDLVIRFVAGQVLAALPDLAVKSYLLPDDEVAKRVTQYLATNDTTSSFYNVDVDQNTFVKIEEA